MLSGDIHSAKEIDGIMENFETPPNPDPDFTCCQWFYVVELVVYNTKNSVIQNWKILPHFHPASSGNPCSKNRWPGIRRTLRPLNSIVPPWS